MLSAVARVSERLIYEQQLSEYFQENNFLTKYQSGFRKFHSTFTSMLKTTNDCYRQGTIYWGSLFPSQKGL